MSDWEVDGVADNAWSPLEEVAWIQCESKGDRIVPQPGTLRGSSCRSSESIQKGTGELSGHNRKLTDQAYQRLNKPDASPKSETFEDGNAQESGYRANGKIISPRKGDWYEYTSGSSLSVLQSNALDRSNSAFKEVHEVKSKKETSQYSFEGAEMCKGESTYSADGSDIVNSSCHFLLSDMCPPGGDLEFLADVQDEVRRDNLLEFGWGITNNLEDMDKLFSSNDSILSRGFDNTTGMLWEPPSPTLGDSLESLPQQVTTPVNPEFVTRGVAKGLDAKAEAGMNKSLSKLETIPVSEEWRGCSHDKQYVSAVDDACLPMQVGSCTDCSNGSNWESQAASAGRNRGSECLEKQGFLALKEADKVSKTMQFGLSRSEDNSIHAVKECGKWKTSKGRRHGPRSKRLEDNVRASGRRMAINLGQGNSTPLMYVPVVPIAQESSPASAQVSRVSSCEPISPMQGLQPVPYVHAGYGFPTHHLPVVVSTPSVMPQPLQPHGQQVFISYQPPFIDAPKLQPTKGTFDVSSSQSPTASSTMTPQEKIEKLRWRQKMQARLAVEQQQQQLINQRLIPEQAQSGRPIHSQLNNSEEVLGVSVRLTQSQCAEPLNWNERSLSVEGAMIEDGDDSLAATVLHQLLNITSRMDTRTRLCLRDGFCRLARNAKQRRATGDRRDSSKRSSSEFIDRSYTAESSSSSEQSCSQRLLTVDDIVETETNPMDRFIAHLLFHKRFPSPYTPLHMNGTPCNNLETSEQGAFHQNGQAWKEANQLSHLSPLTRSSSVTGEVVVSRGTDVATSDITMCEKGNIQSDCLAQPVVSSLELEKVLNFSAISADDSLHLVERETRTADMDPCIAPSAGSMDISDEVAKPLLQAM